MTVRILQGDAPKILQTLPERSVHCVVTSPPYWALRSYLKADDPLKPLELGSEKTPDEHVERMVAVFREVRRVLRDDGLLWVNYGDSYSASGNGGNSVDSVHQKQRTNAGSMVGDRSTPGLSPLQRVGIPERFALAMQADGWLWRDTIIWRKLSPMPASMSGTAWVRCRVKVANAKVPHPSQTEHGTLDRIQHKNSCFDMSVPEWQDCPGCQKCEANGGYVLRRGSWRTTTAHEYIFMFAKKAGYFADQEGVKEPCAAATIEREKYTRILDDPDEQYAVSHDHESISGGMRNPRSVMSFKQHNLKEKHYAAFPPALAEFCIKASTSPKGVCPVCGAQWSRVIDRPKSGSWHNHDADGVQYGGKQNGNGPSDNYECTKTLGFRPTCLCVESEPIPATVLDIFGGSGTVGLVADRLGHDAILIELNHEYATMSRRRITKDAGMFAAVE